MSLNVFYSGCLRREQLCSRYARHFKNRLTMVMLKLAWAPTGADALAHTRVRPVDSVCGLNTECWCSAIAILSVRARIGFLRASN